MYDPQSIDFRISCNDQLIVTDFHRVTSKATTSDVCGRYRVVEVCAIKVTEKAAIVKGGIDF